MWVNSHFPGDGEIDMYIHRLQHNVYGEALSIIAKGCERHTEWANAILGYWDWERISTDKFDHRTLQDAHDILAAVWRFRYSFKLRQFNFPVGLINSTDPNYKIRWSRWSGWREWRREWERERGMEHQLTAHWLNWIRSEIESWRDYPTLVRLVMKILANQNQPVGYQAEAELAWELLTSYDDVPWHKERLNAVEGGLYIYNGRQPQFRMLPARGPL